MQTVEKVTTRWVFFKGISVFSKAIKFWTRSQYSHVAYLLNDTTLIEVWGSDPFRICWDFVTPPFAKHEPRTPIEIWSLDLPIDEYLVVDKFMRKLALQKAPYDWLGVFGFILKLEKHKRQGYFCSEGCTAALCKAKNWQTIKPHHISPVSLLNLIEAMGGKKEQEFTL